MRSGMTTLGATAAAVALAIAAGAPVAGAQFDEYAMNGTFSVVSNGEWAQMNERYQDQPTVRSTWTVDTVCSSALACSGTVTSSLGWTANIYTVNGGMWYVKHDVPEWIPCDDGTRAPGLQVYSFYSAAPDGTSQRFSDLWLGKDETTGASGNCGRNLPLVLTMPVKISRTG